MKNLALILGILLVVAATLGCTSNAQSGKQSGNNINFSLPDGWELHPMPGEGTVIAMGNDPRIRIIKMKDIQKYNSKHEAALNIDNASVTLKKQNETIDNTKVEIFFTTDNDGNIQDLYFFSKNNKYYYLLAWAYPGWTSKESINRQEISKAVETIVKTVQ